MSEQTVAAATTADSADFQDGYVVGEFRVGRVLSQTFRSYFRNVISFTLIVLIVLVPVFLLSFIIGAVELSQTVNTWLAAGLGVAEWLMGTIATAAIAFGAYQDMAGRKVSIGGMFRRGLPMIFPVIGVTLVVSILAGLGSILLVIPGIMIWTAYMVVIPATVVEGLGVSDSMKRSADLTRGFRWKVFGSYFLASIVVALFHLLTSSIGVALLARPLEATGDAIGAIAIGAMIASVVAQALGAGLLAALVAVVYKELRTAKEGTDVEQIAAVFD